MGWSDRLALIAQHGWLVQGVGEAEGAPQFAYTIGLSQVAPRPELLVIGLPQMSVMMWMLNELGRRVVEGAPLQLDTDIEGVIEGFPVRLLSCPASVYDTWTCQAEIYCHQILGRRQLPPVWQVVYPDGKGRWPWTTDTSRTFRARQPIVGLHTHGA